MHATVEQALVLQVIVWLVVTEGFFISGQASLFHPVTVYLLFHGLAFVLRPCLVVFLGFDSVWNYMHFSPAPDDLVKCLAVSSLALVVFASACLFCGRCRVDFQSRERAGFSRPEAIGLCLTTLLLAPLIAYSIHVTSSGQATGVNVGGAFIMTGSSGYANDAQLMGGALICAWLAMTQFRWPMLLVVAAYVGYRSYMGWARWTILLFFLATALTYAWQTRRRWMPVWFILLLIPTLVLFNNLGKNRMWFRDMLVTGHSELPDVSENLGEAERLRQKFDNLDFANFDFLTYIVAMVPERTGKYTYGAQHLQLFTEPIPRILWKSKPIGSPVRTFNLNQYGNFNGLTISMAGDGWMSGGWLGVALTAGFAGMALGFAHRWFWVKARNSSFASLIYILGVALIAQHFRDGNVVSIAKFCFWNMSPLLLWMAITWLLKGTPVPARSTHIPANTRVRFAWVETGQPVRGSLPGAHGRVSE